MIETRGAISAPIGPIETRVLDYLAIEDLPHPQIVERINGQDVLLDTKIANLVLMFNRFEQLRTVSSCQGSTPDPARSVWDAHIAIRGLPGTLLARFAFVTLHALIHSADVWASVTVNKESEPTLWLNLPQECIPKAEEILAAIQSGQEPTR
jgi:hypothetical protein